MFTFGATGAMDFHEQEVAELVVAVGELRTSVLEKLSGELLASPDEQLEKNFTASAMTANRLVIEWLRLKCEQLYHQKMKLAGKTEAPLWNPTNDDIVLNSQQWRKVITAAKSGGWDQEANTGFTDLLNEYQQARLTFENEKELEAPNLTTLEQQRGLVLGALDQFEQKLKVFRPVTIQKFLHPGLIAYRDDMLELCLAARIQCS
ncbi:MAG: hypothetical protein ACI87E_000395 [Mariniblastus sp.]|jgi:hypothetical protein